MKCAIVDPKQVNWERLDSFADRTVFQTREWLNFVAESQRATPVVAELRQDGEIAGYFSGLTFSRMGVRVLGSSFPGWTTPYLGFTLVPRASPPEGLAGIEKLAWHTLKRV